MFQSVLSFAGAALPGVAAVGGGYFLYVVAKHGVPAGASLVKGWCSALAAAWSRTKNDIASLEARVTEIESALGLVHTPVALAPTAIVTPAPVAQHATAPLAAALSHAQTTIEPAAAPLTAAPSEAKA